MRFKREWCMAEAPANGSPKDLRTPAFWDWSLEHYRRSGAESLLLRLQDEMGLSVNMLLWSMWCAERFETAPDLYVRNAIDAVAPWQTTVVAPLRSVRRSLKSQTETGGAEDLRAQVKTAELAAEKIEQTVLERVALAMLTPAKSRTAETVRRRARQNLTTYAALMKAPQRKGFSTSLLQSLIDRIFESAPDGPGFGSNPRVQQNE